LTPFASDDARKLNGALRALDRLEDGDPLAIDSVLGRRIAGTSKVYAMYAPHHWVIYDSRLARGLALLVAAGPADRRRDLTDFPQPPGRDAGRGVAGFPGISVNATSQAVLAFVYASWFARALAAELELGSVPRPANDRWSPMHIEMALFEAGVRPLVPPEGDSMTPTVAARGAAAGSAAVVKQALDALGITEVAKNTGKSEAQRQLEKTNAFRNAVRYAQQTGSRLVRLQFADGEQRYVVFKDQQAIAAFPSYDGDLNDALIHHDRSCFELLAPDEALEPRRTARAKRTVKERVLRRAEDDDAVESEVPAATNAILALPAGDPLGEDELLDPVFDDKSN
jgi:hypothetical protein